nr:hypothetical protein DO63_5788 [Burkholderia pseudomallei]
MMRDARRVKRAASLAASCPSERDRFVVERRVRDAVRDRRIVDVAAQHPPAPILRQEPQTIARRRPVRRAVGVKADRRGRLRERPGAVIAEQPRRDLFDGHADRVRLREPSGRLHPMRRIVEPRARIEQRAHQQARRIRVQRDELAPARERLFRMVGPHFARRRDRPARAARLGDRIPRLAHAQPVEFARRERADHLRRRNHDAADIVQRIDAVRREPVIQPHRMRAGRERLREHGAPAECRERGLQLARRAVRVGEPVRERDRLAVAVQHHRHRQVGARPADAELHAVDEPVQRVRGVELARQQLVANARPRRLPAELERQAVACAELEPLRGDERRGVAQRDEADAQAGAFRHIGGRCFDARCVHAFCTFVQDCECAASSRRAASTIRMPWSIALRRSVAYASCSDSLRRSISMRFARSISLRSASSLSTSASRWRNCSSCEKRASATSRIGASRSADSPSIRYALTPAPTAARINCWSASWLNISTGRGAVAFITASCSSVSRDGDSVSMITTSGRCSSTAAGSRAGVATSSSIS